MLQINILHLIVACAAGATIFALLREAQGRSMPPAQLFAALPFALVAAMLLIAMQSTASRQPFLWLASLAVGLAVGVARGFFLTLHLDRLYSRLRLPQGRDGLWAACLLALCVLVAFGASLAALPDAKLEVGATSVVAACAGYLGGRAATLWRRSLSAPHSTLHHSSP